ncbi:uncharacterized protein isoform X2 [Salmo salar]|uniref:Uncharacterized protein isoform X2 n=1 Tax=Salmo salar TaxID=8030 RepID=A0A1S3Q4X8_SALSA|nr:uncharacterized protein LOC106589469 isoform X2 [Salmo salar]|eukprot:XP_014034972.1 PREDICTED: uncharacterized protein LOC106589469 [Salmo salar]
MVNDELGKVESVRVIRTHERQRPPGSGASRLGGDKWPVPRSEACGSLWDLQGSVPHGLFRPLGHTELQLRPRQLSTSSLWESLDAQRDEHLLDSEGECVRWLVGNIPGGAVTSGEDLCQYLAPIPTKATGFHRFVYILFRQEGTINFHEDI